MPAFTTMGALSLGSSLLGGAASASQAKAAAIQQKMARDASNFAGKMQNDTYNRNLMRQNIAREIQNKRIQEAAVGDKALRDMLIIENYQNAQGQYSRKYHNVMSGLQTAFTARGISSDSGTARALLRANQKAATNSMLNLKKTRRSQESQAEAVYNNTLAGRNFNYNEYRTFVPNMTPAVDNSSSIMANAVAQGVMSAATIGVAGATSGLEGGTQQAWQLAASLYGSQ